MAKTTSRNVPASAVLGNVFDAVSKQGIPNLLVTAYHVDRAVAGAGNSELEPLLKGAKRIGSVASDETGSFRISYDRRSSSSNGQATSGLLVVISAADDEQNRSAGRVIYHSNVIFDAGLAETINVGVSRGTIEKFRLDGAANVKEALSAYKSDRTDERTLSAGVAEFHRAEIERDTRDKVALRAELLSAIATNVKVAVLPGEIVREDESIKEKVEAVAARGVGSANKRIGDSRGVPVNLFLTPEDRVRLQPFFDSAVDGFATIPERELQDILFRSNSSENPGTLLVHQNPIAKFCAQQTFEEKCAKLHTGLSDAGEHEHGETGGDGQPGTGVVTGPNVETLTNDDIPKYVARLLNSAPSPDTVLSPAFNAQRADTGVIEDSVEQFSLRKGPAEVPAFYDFHSLQIAFDHVWKILVDEDVVQTAHTLEKKYKQKTGLSLSTAFSRNWSDLLNATLVYQSIPQEVPPEVAAQFDINLPEWSDLSAAHQAKLRECARVLTAACDTTTGNGGGFAGGFGFIGSGARRPLLRRGSYAVERLLQDVREQGERLIDSVRHDDYYTMHKTLRELQSRLNGSYEFTVFAADKNTHSVNFGLFNTYRQLWTPLNYQAGQLVKTIPLAPKEERRFSLKVARTLKVARKEAIKNNSSLTSEQSSTSRVEAEIMEKAQNKTNFNLSTDGSYNIGISKGKATTTFGVEAQQESSEHRKDFREAVLKAVQDYKEERSVEVTTDDTTTSEYNESGTIVNPNDELSVTYLFYELQRRYRIAEQLYRVLPVVLVAQEVPAPHQITESWVIAYDWIINRCLLDDSFRKALEYLATKSVGDDFALRELRKNLRQQRNLVETLRLELAVASDESQRRYRALENSIEKRIAEESDENTDGFLSDVGDFFGGGGQDPEAAKARELAAKDAHQYAVEKAEKAAAALRQEMNNLHALTAEYNSTLRNHLDNETCVKRLLVHIRSNILYYMQAIWSMEPPDQRFLRLHKVQVPQLDLATVPDPGSPGGTMPNRQYRVQVIPSKDIFETFRAPGTTKHKAFMRGVMAPVSEFRALVEVADLDNLLGFKGNYMIFPMKEHNALTEFMAAPYVDSAFGAMDPDELTNVSLSDFGKYVCCLHEKLPPDRFDALKEQLKEWLELLLADPLRNGDEIVVPTNSLFIEILCGARTLMENFKLRHRELDVYKVQEEVRRAGLEALRLASRLINNEREDPDIEKKIVVETGVSPGIDVDN
jgi:hypothetical protein